jgi:gluconate 5-dehydrogenase
MMLQDLFGLQGRTALVTGSTQGLGTGMAVALAQAGARVAINGRDPAKVAAVVADLKQQGLDVIAAPFDLADQAQMEAGVDSLERAAGRIDILVNNAAVMRRVPLAEMTRDEWRAVMDTDLDGVMFLSQRVVRPMLERRAGKIVNILSLAAVTGRLNIAAYSTAKAGLMGLTRQMALEWGRHNVQVNAIGPGWFASPMSGPNMRNKDLEAWLMNRTPAQRWGDPGRDLAGAVIYLASGASDFVMGQTIFVDGGHMTANGM